MFAIRSGRLCLTEFEWIEDALTKPKHSPTSLPELPCRTLPLGCRVASRNRWLREGRLTEWKPFFENNH